MTRCNCRVCIIRRQSNVGQLNSHQRDQDEFGRHSYTSSIEDSNRNGCGLRNKYLGSWYKISKDLDHQFLDSRQTIEHRLTVLHVQDSLSTFKAPEKCKNLPKISESRIPLECIDKCSGNSSANDSEQCISNFSEFYLRYILP